MTELQQKMLEIAKDFKRVCDEHNLRYSLYGGTLIGAIRHKGFIPWDDDMDFCMPRPDFDKLVELDKEYKQKGKNLFNSNYKLQHIALDNCTRTHATILIALVTIGLTIYHNRDKKKLIEEATQDILDKIADNEQMRNDFINKILENKNFKQEFEAMVDIHVSDKIDRLVDENQEKSNIGGLK